MAHVINLNTNYMKKTIIVCIIAFAVGLFRLENAQAQGIVYLSSLSQTSTGIASVGSNSWLAALFFTGNNVGGYVLNSAQLGMTDASGNPGNFRVMLYTAAGVASVFPGSSLGTLSGSTNPATAGNFTFVAPSNLVLTPNAAYFIVLTSGTAIANGAYNWNESSFPPNSSGGWSVGTRQQT